MNEPPTMILRESDEDRTLVDRATHRARQTRSTARAILSSHRREIIEVGVAFTLLVGLGLVMHQQQQAAHALREVLTEIRAARQSSSVLRPHSTLRRPESPQQRRVKRRPADNELSAEQRAELEQQAAALIASNDFPAALRQYEALASIFPDDRTFRDVVMVLRAKLRCGPSLGPGRGACR